MRRGSIRGRLNMSEHNGKRLSTEDAIGNCLGGCIGIALGLTVLVAMNTAAIWCGSWLITKAWPEVMRLSWLQSLAAAFVISIVLRPFWKAAK